MKKLLKIGAVIAASLTLVTESFASGGGLVPFNNTNYLTAGTITTSWPTNNLATNALFTGTVYIGTSGIFDSENMTDMLHCIQVDTT